ncbi:hypothetical protein OESDEN_03159 [Oesophagostomum dentatum]|uniref:SCP domain-containing protein n=1 Tax=Oesophagostomum dentatum TaxID=61180 RepID=A0A0B1THW5_OESDE|nr:hypothetical protein OESDEN_03159 [Oesophagostomum dentatum]
MMHWRRKRKRMRIPAPTNGSDLATRPESGENFEALASTTTPYLDAFTQTLTTWWEQILINGVNNQMKYTQYLESKAKAPIKFTQMGWADSYKVGCGIKRCASSTVIVCRYNPRGNIYSQYIYNSGTLCASCSVCNDGLCPTPA